MALAEVKLCQWIFQLWKAGLRSRR